MSRLEQALPVVSVILPVRNGERFLAEALKSLVTQRGVDLEIIAIDDASSDGTPAVLAAFATEYPCVRPISGQGRGLSRALNLGLGLARGRYIARMDADDIALPGRLAAQFDFLEHHAEVGVLGTQAWRIDVAGARYGRIRVPTGRNRVRTALETSSALIHPSVMMRREPLLDVGAYRPLLDGAEDYDLWLRLSEITEVDNLAEPWVLCRRHDSQVTVRRALRQARCSALALVSHGLREAGMPDPLAGHQSLSGWRHTFETIDPALIPRIRALAAASLVDNGGSLRPRGTEFLQAVCMQVKHRSDRFLARRVALACVRHQLQLFRAKRWREALACLPNHLLCCNVRLLTAYLRHAGILRRSRSGLRL